MKKYAKPQRKSYIFSISGFILFGLVFGLILSQVIISNHFVTSGVTISELEEKTRQLSEENEDLRQKIASSSSLLTLEKKAKNLGFKEKTSFISVSSKFPVALESTK